MVLADISGFTAFMETSEIDHSATITQNLLQLIIKGLTPVMTVAEVEGDAVFAYVPAEKVTRGELLLELIETTYTAFRDQRHTMAHNATCPCAACQGVSRLDLKFIIHYGPYVLQKMTGRFKPVGSSVIAAHRLLKNRIQETTGWRAYALFSELSLEKMGVRPENLHVTLESYPDLETIRASGFNLDKRYQQLINDRIVILSTAEADYSIPFTFPAEPPIVWDWLTDPIKRNNWSNGAAWSAIKRPHGRTGPAAQNHCSSSGAIEEILDWRPFNYYTVNLSKWRFNMLITSALEPVGKGTRLQFHMKSRLRLPRRMRRCITRYIADRIMRLEEAFGNMAGMLADNHETTVEKV